MTGSEGLSFQEKLRLMCADETESGLSNVTDYQASGGWTAAPKVERSYLPPPPPRRPSPYSAYSTQSSYSSPTRDYEPVPVAQTKAVSVSSGTWKPTTSASSYNPYVSSPYASSPSTTNYDQKVSDFDSQKDVFD